MRLLTLKFAGFGQNAKNSVQFRIHPVRKKATSELSNGVKLSKTGTFYLPSHNNIQSPLKEPKSAGFLIFRYVSLGAENLLFLFIMRQIRRHI